ncbi:hypothetical protein [Trinickia caryophylli]|uniref:hypothetical protein n=1 Tax=Trinickia caryophylli TaxID=28094 RepID=UPI000C885181|nr:hypothetical protein [Trinickia caryophylli]PMS11062.1 hypothetical protein C0Z17_16330 [Trinickia caryophylli]TRX14519.1 hypothetical protein FNF07_24955 [Trinickia caryophylli]WQE14357.1 hypothetical protein U0034_27145 [Trinickia caryophylli]
MTAFDHAFLHRRVDLAVCTGSFSLLPREAGRPARRALQKAYGGVRLVMHARERAPQAIVEPRRRSYISSQWAPPAHLA